MFDLIINFLLSLMGALRRIIGAYRRPIPVPVPVRSNPSLRLRKLSETVDSYEQDALRRLRH